MSFLDHLDELRRRIILSVAFIFVALVLCWFVSDHVYNFLAVTYVLACIGLVDARFLVSHWRASAVVILVAAAVLSPTNDVPNMMLFAAPMVVLYLISILIAWMSARPRTAA